MPACLHNCTTRFANRADKDVEEVFMDLSIPLSGMQTASAAFDSAARSITQASVSAPSGPGDSADLSSAVVGLLAAKLSFFANEKVASIEDNLTKNEISVLA
jgi:hypothetical protein